MGASQWELTLAAPEGAIQPGAAATVGVTLRNATERERLADALNADSVRFYLRRPGQEALRLLEPARSTRETVAPPQLVAPGGTLERRFALPSLALERGEFLLLAIYANLSGESGETPERAYGGPAAVTVAGDLVATHRTPDGLVAREDALGLARRHFGLAAATPGRARQTIDPMGFVAWLVVLEPAGGPARACLINAALGRVDAEVDPATLEAGTAEGSAPEGDTRRLRELRERARQ
jgi:hypothetical protein